MAKPAKGDLNTTLRSFMANMGLDDDEIKAELAKPAAKPGQPGSDEYAGPPIGPARRRTGRPRKPWDGATAP